MSKVVTALIILLVLFGIVILLQVYLSTRPSKGLGLVLPVLCLIYSLVMVFSFMADPEMTQAQLALAMGGTFLLCNIPTIGLLAIYFFCRSRSKRKRELDRMKSWDLE